MLFVEAPTTEKEMETICREAPGHHLANMLEDGATPFLPDAALEAMGYKLVAHPFALLGSSILAMKKALATLKSGESPQERVSFQELKEDVGFEEYYREEERYVGEE